MSPVLDASTALRPSPYFYTKFLRLGEKRASFADWKHAWTWKAAQISTTIRTVHKIIIPVSLDNHWVLLHADLKNLRIQILDSWKANYKPQVQWTNSQHAHLIQVIITSVPVASGILSSEQHAHLIQSMVLLLDKIRGQFGRDCVGDPERFRKEPHVLVPFQGNDFDCGIYTVMFARHLQYGLEVNHKDVTLRDRVPKECTNLNFMCLAFLDEIVPI
ncbi:hypothetical protein FPV67DRAFT_1673910 [Lyophyllum atratum]|nr:hypothetical protein FPV67DRAFT_1673910 [Lyophyllum atratum]